MSYQFFHIETYARVASTKVKPTKPKNGGKAPAAKIPKPKATVGDVLGEVMRDAGNCPHVANPQPPNFLYGNEDNLRAIPLEIEINIEAHQAKHGGRVLRKDAHVLLAGVASFPRELMESDPDRYQKWKDANLDFLKRKYGKSLKAVVEHLDEEHPHIHFYVLDADHVNAKELHDGHKASVGLTPMTKEYNVAYNNAMREVQTDYYTQVGHPLGLLRDGPKEQRLDRATWKTRKTEASARYALDQQSAEKRSQIDLKASQLDHELQNVPMVVDAKVAEKVSAKVKALESNYADKEAHLGNQHLKKRDGLEAKELALNEREAQLKDEAKRLAKPMAKTMATRMANTQILELFESELEPIPSAPTGIFSGAKWKETYDHMKHLVVTLQKKLAVSDRAVTFARESYEVRGKEALKSVERVKSLTDQVESLLKNDAEQATLMNQMRAWMPVQVDAVMAAIDYAQASNAERRKMDIKKHLPVLKELNKDYADTMMKDLHI